MSVRQPGRRVVLITGASRGLGAAAAQEAARLGASVVLCARSGADLEEQARAIQEAGGRAVTVAGDVSQEEDCRRMVERAIEAYGRIDALVNNSGIIEPISPVAEADFGDWMLNWSVNVLGPVMLTRFSMPFLRERQGRILHISSGAARNAIPGWAAYSAAKAAINQITQVLAAEEPGVTTLAVRPGVVDTAMQAVIRESGAAAMADEDHLRFKRLHEQGALLPPELPGRAIACLALYAPREWSGEFLSWDEERVQELVRGGSERQSRSGAAE